MLDTDGHLWPDSDDNTRVTIDSVMAAREDSLTKDKRGGQMLRCRSEAL
jgi:hypothetical protein